MNSPGARRNIFAYTPPGEYPPYLSINREPNGSVIVTVRAPASRSEHHYPNVICGTDATMTVPAAQWRALIAALALEPDLWPGAQQ